MTVTVEQLLAGIRGDFPELSDHLTLIGPLQAVDLTGKLDSEIALTRTIDGATTIVFTLDDHDRALQAVGVLSDAQGNLIRSFIQARGFNMELARVEKGTDDVTLTFEDAIVAKLKRVTTPDTIADAGTMTRTQIAQKLAHEAGVRIVCSPAARDVVQKAVVRNETGKSAKDGTAGDEVYTADPTGTDTSWTLLSSLASEAQMRVFSDGLQLVFGDDPWLHTRVAPMVLTEDSDAVHNIAYTADVGASDASATVTMDADAFSMRAGDPATIPVLGAASGTWLNSQWSEDLGRDQGTLTLTRAQSSLTEAQIDPDGDAGDEDFLPDDPDDSSVQAAAQLSAAAQGAINKLNANMPGVDITAGLSGRRKVLVATAASEIGCKYVYGKQGPTEWDCSGLVGYAAKAAGRPLPRTATAMMQACQGAGVYISWQVALKTKGALLFRVGYPGEGPHVVISLGDGTTLEARGSAYHPGVDIFGGAANRHWTGGGLWV